MLENVIQATLTVMNDDVIRRYIMFSIPFFFMSRASPATRADSTLSRPMVA